MVRFRRRASGGNPDAPWMNGSAERSLDLHGVSQHQLQRMMRGTKLFAHRRYVIYHRALSCYFPQYGSLFFAKRTNSYKSLFSLRLVLLPPPLLLFLSLALSLSGAFISMIDNDPGRAAASRRLHSNFVIRHVYNQLIINHT